MPHSALPMDRVRRFFFLSLALCIALAPRFGRAAEADGRDEHETHSVRLQPHVAGRAPGQRLPEVRATVVNFSELARLDAQHKGQRPPLRTWMTNELEEPDEPLAAPAPDLGFAPIRPFVASPSPISTFMGLDDIPMADSSYVVIPPDCGGAVGPTRIMQGLNNNYRILDKSTGAVISTLGTATFWAPTGETALNGLTDPRTLYDPYNNRWIVEMQTVTTGAGDILVGVSQTSDPAGAWNLYKFATGATIDFPIVGFNKNWVVVTINKFTNGGSFQNGITLVADYGQLRIGTLAATLFTQSAGTHFCTAPCVTYSTTSDTLYLVTHLSSAGATYAVDKITGTSAAPVYTAGGTLTRAGGGWVQPSGNIMPQSAPNSGTSACGTTPCPIEAQDAQIRSAPVFRNGNIYYAQTVGLPSTGLTHTAAQWTKLTTPGGTVVDGGRIDDATATATNGGKWYSNVHVAVNAAGDFVVGYTQFSSAQHPSTGYSVHVAGDAAGTIRDPLVYKAGEDYYHKTFSTATGRNRWGDFSQAQVDPSDDNALWVIQEYGKNRTGTNDGNTGTNSSRWSTYWAKVSLTPLPTVTLSPGPSLNEGNSGTTSFPFTVNLSQTSSQPVTVHFHTLDGTAMAANNDYVGVSDTVSVLPGNLTATINVTVNGDTTCEGNETFNVGMTSVENGVLGAPSTVTATILNDDSKTITASAGPNGAISPLGAVNVACGGSQSFTITPDAHYHVADVVVDGVSVGAVTSYPFTNVTQSHTIDASFAIDQQTLAVTVVGHGSVTKAPNQPTYDYGSNVDLTATPDPGYTFAGWSGDASGNASPLSVTMDADKNITATFTDIGAPTVQVTAPNGGESVVLGANLDITWTAADNESVTVVDLLLSRNGVGGPYEDIVDGVANTGLYSWAVTGPPTDSALVKVVAHDLSANTGEDVSDSLFQITDAVAAQTRSLVALAFDGVQPNPSSGSVSFRYGLPRDAAMRLAILDVHGREVAVVTSGQQSSGWHGVSWSGTSSRGRAGAGVYFAELSSEGRTIVRRFALLR
ncbi:MAG TPA: Calx-beta domain-containing protein [Candidatus Eisenbacteria bacterium]|nr:Calx-beta domain-containing protein [Candidatus Eisenbacteria bacterium]